MSPLYLHQEQILLYSILPVALCYFYSSPEWTNQTLAQERAFCIVTLPKVHRRFCCTLLSAEFLWPAPL